MRRTCCGIGLGLVLLVTLIPPSVNAMIWDGPVFLDGAQVQPPTPSPSFASGFIAVDTDSNTLFFDIQIEQPLLGNELLAAIRGPAAPFQNAPMLFQLPPGPFKVGVWDYPEFLEPDILGGFIYMDIQTDQFPNGEIRGQIDQLQPQGLTRQDAVDLVLEAIIPQSPFQEELVAFMINLTGPDSILTPGTVVTDWESLFVETITEDSYFFWFDDEPNFEWTHHSTFVFVNAFTGDVVMHESESWPVINGQEVLIMTDGNDSPNRVRGNYQVQNVTFNYTPVDRANSTDWALVVVGRNLSGNGERKARVNDIKRIQECLNGTSLGPRIDKDNIIVASGTNTMGATIQAVCDSLDKMDGCRKLYFHYIGHGDRGAMLLKKSDANATDRFKYKELACKLLEKGIQEVCITIEACHSGSALAAIKNKRVGSGRNKRGLKGTVITSSPSNKPTSRIDCNGAPFVIAMNECCKDPLADLNKDGKVTITEAIAWARVQNSVVDSDGPQGITLGDGGTIVFFGPIPITFTDGSDAGGSLCYEIQRYCYRIVRPGPDELACRRFLYVSNKTGSPHRGAFDIQVVCKRPGKPDSVLVTRRINLRAKRNDVIHRICLGEIPADCLVNEKKPKGLIRKKPNKPTLSITAVPVEPGERLAAASDETVILKREGTYFRGDIVLQEVEITGLPGDMFTTSLDSIPGWNMEMDPPFFEASAILDTQVVFIRGDVPLAATEGGPVLANIINTTAGDTVQMEITALLYDSLTTGITDGDSHQYRALDVLADGINSTSGVISLQNSVIDIGAAGTISAAAAGQLLLDGANIEVDSTVSCSFDVSGTLDMQNSVVSRLTGGITLAPGATSEIHESSVLLSTGDGLVLFGDQAGLTLDFLFIDQSAGNGLLADGTSNALLQNLHIENSGLMDVVLSNSASVELRDATFDDSKMDVESGSSVVRSWTTSFITTDPDSNPIGPFTIEVRDAFSTLVGSVESDVTGFSDELALVQYEQVGATRTNFTPHSITVRGITGQEQTFPYSALSAELVLLVLGVDVATAVGEDEIDSPRSLVLGQNWPNPFGSPAVGRNTTILYGLPRSTEAQFVVYNVRGQVVHSRRLGRQDPGLRTLTLQSAGLSSGFYWYELQTPERSLRRKLVIVK